jgi:diguanylate cyclase (GGDEF)-like protein
MRSAAYIPIPVVPILVVPILVALLLVVPIAWAQAPPEAKLPVTIDERNAACVDTEDADSPRAIALADSVLAETVLSVAQRAEALGCRGWSHAALERRDDARRDAYALQALLPQLARNRDRVRLTRRVGGILHRSGDRVGAVNLYAQAVADAEAQGLEVERIPLLVNLGVLHSEFEEHERARVNYEQALALMQRLNDFRYEAPVRFNLALNLAGQERDDEAVPHLRRALELIRESGIGGRTQETAVMIALASALSETGHIDEAAELIAAVRTRDVPQDASMRLQFAFIESRRLEQAGDTAGALAALDPFLTEELPEIQQWNLLGRRAALLERLGRYADAAATLREINTLRETYLRHQNHERLAALDAHMRDREQRAELERLHESADAQARQLRANARLQWGGAILAGILLVLGTGLLLWQRRMNRRLFEASRTDALTGLSNRRDITQRLRELSAASRGSAAVMLLDIDLFKRINDEHGHDVGDEVLMLFAQRLRAQAGDDASVARWGGEEFLIVVPDATAASVTALADRLREHFTSPIDTRRGPIMTPVSIGIANLPLPGASGDESWHYSVQLADGALYLAKRAGRDAWACYWIAHAIPDWPPERLGREPQLARSMGIISPLTSRPLREPLAAVVG